MIIIHDFNIFVLYKSKIISKIWIKNDIVLDIINIKLFIFFVRLKIILNQENRIIKLFWSKYIKKFMSCNNILKAKIVKVSI